MANVLILNHKHVVFAKHRRTPLLANASLRFFSSTARPVNLKTVVKRDVNMGAVSTDIFSMADKAAKDSISRIGFQGVHHVALICSNLERSMGFYQGVLGLEINPDRPHDKLPYRGAWLWIGPEMIHLMELPNPDPLEGRPAHGGRDRHFCVGVQSVQALVHKLEDAGIQYTKSMSGRPAVFFRDPDMNCLECVEVEPWR